MLVHNRWFFLQFTWTGEGISPPAALGSAVRAIWDWWRPAPAPTARWQCYGGPLDKKWTTYPSLEGYVRETTPGGWSHYVYKGGFFDRPGVKLL